MPYTRGVEKKRAVLVVEDESVLATGLCDVLAFRGYTPTAVASGEEGLRRALAGRFALVLLDVMLPALSGLDVCRELRAARPEQAILMLTARGAESDVLEGFRAGADDYVTKPFSVAELMARVEALLRRSGRVGSADAKPFTLGRWRIDPAGRTAADGKKEVELSQREVDLLAVFARDRGRIVSRRTLLVEVWGMNHVDQIQTRTVDVHVGKLRRKLGMSETGPLETVRGEGYRFLD
jgi:DNA-binding response OmpR family regulator